MSKIQELLAEYDTAVNELIIAETAASKAKALRLDAERIHKEITEELIRLDVVQRGNFGWEKRTVTFLLHLFRGKKTNE